MKKKLGHKSFSVYITVTFVLLSICYVSIILLFLHMYLSKKAEREFRARLVGENRQVTAILNGRFREIKDRLRELVNDNTIRVTLLLGAKNQLKSRVMSYYTPGNGAYYFVQKNPYTPLIPETYPGLSDATVRYGNRYLPNGRLVVEGNKTRIIWWFSAPIMNGPKEMGMGNCLYDILEDKKLLESLRHMLVSDIVAISGHRLFSLKQNSYLPPEYNQISFPSDFSLHKNQDYLTSAITGYRNLFLVTSCRQLKQEKKKIASIIFISSIFVLIAASTVAIFLSNLMMKPLQRITEKALMISQGNRDLFFETGEPSFVEFEQLSNAFNLMLSRLKDAEEQSRYKELLENVDDAVYIYDFDGIILEANEAAASMAGIPYKEFIGTSIREFLSSKVCDHLLNQTQTPSNGDKKNKITLVTNIIRSDEKEIHVEIVSRPIVYRGKQVLLNVARDITPRIQAQEALKESELRYRTVVENSSDAIMVMDDNFRILYSNRVFPEITGYSIDEILNTDFRQYIEDTIIDMDHLLHPEGQGKILSDEYTLTCKNGDKKRVKIRANRYTDSNNNSMTVAFVLDITDQVRMLEEKHALEEQLIHAQKMEAIGALAGGIAHDFNNILMGIQGHVSVMLMKAGENNPLYKDIIEIQKSVQSAGRFTRQLLGFSRKERFKPRPIPVNEIVERSISIFSRSKKEVIINKELGKEIPMIEADPDLIEQALMNLYVNAWQAMDGGGEIFIRTEAVFLSEDFCHTFGIKPGRYVKISIRDTGSGMSQETMNRIFEPFFTTKKMGKGTGLGLTLVYKTVTNHRGIINVKSRLGQGTTFFIYLPALEEKKGHSNESSEKSTYKKKVLRGNETILIIDDDRVVVETQEIMLRELGYHVLKAKSGEEGIRLFKESPRKPDIVILDIIMPGMNGKETFAHLRKIDPHIKVLAISGQGVNQYLSEMMESGCNGFIEKPFEIQELSKKIRDILDKA